MANYNFSYSTIADVYAVELETGDKRLGDFAAELERAGVASFDGVEYIYRNSNYGMEIVSMEDYQSEQEDDDEEY